MNSTTYSLSHPFYHGYSAISVEAPFAHEAEILLSRYDLAPEDLRDAVREYSERVQRGEERGEPLIRRILYAIECECVSQRRT